MVAINCWRTLCFSITPGVFFPVLDIADQNSDANAVLVHPKSYGRTSTSRLQTPVHPSLVLSISASMTSYGISASKYKILPVA